MELSDGEKQEKMHNSFNDEKWQKIDDFVVENFTIEVAIHRKIGGITMLTTTNTEQLFGLACSGNIEALEDYWNKQGNLNVTYERFGNKHSLIMGAFRNQQYDTVRWLKNHGCRLTDEEQKEIDIEYMRIKSIGLLVSDVLKS